ncbi:MAG TPA: KpsF/GutQ family sugar-phosphate isomerase [Candidatus Polarisedimenticolaceae bacterium]|nr:KpsF/GutQ family sugar-phosphate isomerase [Candidatus Polarisedimenticolaceae bacterium]
MPSETARRVLRIEAQAVAELADRVDAAFDRAVEHLVGCRGRVIVTGMGKSGLICQKIAATLSSTGCPAYFMHPAEALHGDLGMLVAGDVLLAVSNSGETHELVRLLEIVRRLGATIVALTGAPGSTLARLADVHLDVSVREEACGWDLVPTASTTAALAMGDALAVACYEARGFTPQDYARYHPGGRLARKLLEVGMLMHRDDGVPRVGLEATLQQAVEEINRGRLGMTCVVDAAGRLAGVLTDGDLRRRTLRVRVPLEGRVEEAMTREPASIGPAALATEALRLMEQRKITSLPVVDDDRTLLGVIQIHDLWRTQLF